MKKKEEEKKKDSSKKKDGVLEKTSKEKKDEKLGKAPKEKEEKKESSEKTLLDWKNLLVDGFSLEKFQKEPKKETSNLEENLENFRESPRTTNREMRRGYAENVEDERETLREYSRQVSAPRRSFLDERRTDFSSLGKTSDFSPQEYQFSTPELGDFFGFQQEEKYAPIRVERFSRKTKSFSQIEREKFEGVRRNREYKEI